MLGEVLGLEGQVMMPSPRFSMKRWMGLSGEVGSSNSIVVSPAFSIATRTFCSGTSSMCESF